MVQQDGQLSRHRYQRSLLRILVALPRQFQSPPLQIRVRTLLTQNAVRSLHQQLAQIYVAVLADSQLRPALARFTPPRTESYIAPYIPAFPESVRIFYRQHKSQRDQTSYSTHLAQQFGFRIIASGQLLQLLIAGFNLLGQRFHRFQQRPERLHQYSRKTLHLLHSHLIRIAGGQSFSHRLGQATRCIHQSGARIHQCRPHPYLHQVPLRLLAAMPDRPQQLRVHARQPRQGLRIQPIILPAAGADQLHLSGIRHDHLVPKAAQQPAYPRRMCPHFDRDPTLWQVTKPLFHPFLSRRHGAFAHHLSLAVQHIIVTGLVSQVHADRNRSLAGFAPLRTLQTSAILLHGRFSFFAPRVRIHWELIASRWGPAFSFHLGYPWETVLGQAAICGHGFQDLCLSKALKPCPKDVGQPRAVTSNMKIRKPCLTALAFLLAGTLIGCSATATKSPRVSDNIRKSLDAARSEERRVGKEG